MYEMVDGEFVWFVLFIKDDYLEEEMLYVFDIIKYYLNIMFCY